MAKKPKKPKSRSWAPVSVGETAGQSAAEIHLEFQTQIMSMLDDSTLSEEDKQRILVSLQCPCCGGGGASFTMQL
jgi:hypothetical protein